jgi:arginase family enzyme
VVLDEIVAHLKAACEVGLLGGDVMEVAPPLARSAGGPGRTLAVAARYFHETADAVLRMHI